MDRRDFLFTGTALGVLGLSGVRPAVAVPALPKPRPSDTLLLNSNENPLGLSPAARKAVIDGIAQANRYPDDSENRLLETLAITNGVTKDQIVLGAGSTEVLQMLVQATAIAGGTVIMPNPTFEDVERYAAPFPANIVKIPLDDQHAHNIDQMRGRAERAARPVLVYICNPNNPTGTVTPSRLIDEWIDQAPGATTFLVDEAYFEYVDDPRYWSSLRWVASRPNVVVVRTFSKIYGMAGLRVGYGISHAETAAKMRRFISGNNTNHLGLVAALASMGDAELVSRGRASNTKAKQILHKSLEQLGLPYMPSNTNFVMHRINGDLETYIRRMRERGVRVGRPFPPLVGYNRLSIGLPDEMERFSQILREFRSKGWI